jgi:hypothetical protein
MEKKFVLLAEEEEDMEMLTSQVRRGKLQLLLSLEIFLKKKISISSSNS